MEIYVNNFTNKTAIYGFPPRKVKQNEKNSNV